MELSQLRYFLDAAKTQHISKSAQRLHIAQPALSKSIHKLEEELGVPLFTHKGRNVVLTQYGEYLNEKLSPLINTLDEIPSELERMAKGENYTIRLSVLAASTIVTHAIMDFKKKYPKINFRVLQTPKNELYDIEITTALFHNRKTSSENHFIIAEKIFLAVPDTEKYKNRTSIDLSEVQNEGFISLFGSKQLRSICDSFCNNAGFEPNIVFESDSPHAVKNMIGANLGVGFWPEFSWGKIRNDRVKILEISSPVCSRDILIDYNNIKSDNRYAAHFYEFLKKYFISKKNSGQ